MRKCLNKGTGKKANGQVVDPSPLGSDYIRADWSKPSDKKFRMLAEVIAKTPKH